MAGIITVDEYKAWGNLTSSAWDTQVGVLREIAEDLVLELTGCKFDSGTYTELYDGDDTQELTTDYTNIQSITSIKQILSYTDGVANTTTFDADTYGHDGERTVFRLPRDNGQRFGMNQWGEPIDPLQPAGPVFPCGYQNIELVYVAGYDTGDMPKSLKRAVFMIMDSMFDTRRNDTIVAQARTNSGVAVTMKTAAEQSAAITQLIRPWKIAQ
jgi:hypothetical protein